MAILNLRKYLQSIILAAGAMPKNVVAQNCGCAPDECCRKYGYCGTGGEFCGDGCKEGPYYGKAMPSTSNSSVIVANVITLEFFNSIINKASANCPRKKFYTRGAFLKALKSYNKFGKLGSRDDSKREIAAFFAHVTHETGHFCYIEEINGASKDYCDESNKRYPCNPKKKYFGHGPIQLSWNYNYGPAGKANNFDGLNSPETVAKDAVVSFKTALWFWMKNVRPIVKQGFEATIRAINGAIECNGGNSVAVRARIRYYKDYCNKFGVSQGNNLSC